MHLDLSKEEYRRLEAVSLCVSFLFSQRQTPQKHPPNTEKNNSTVAKWRTSSSSMNQKHHVQQFLHLAPVELPDIAW